MKIFNYFIVAFFCLSVLSVLFFALRTKKFLKTLLTSSVIGVACVFLLHFTSAFTGFTLELTPLTLLFSGVFGLPGVVATVVCKLIFGF